MLSNLRIVRMSENRVIDIVAVKTSLPSLSDQSDVTGSWMNRCNPANRQSPMKTFISVSRTAIQTFTCSGLASFHSLNQRVALRLVSITTSSIMVGVMKTPNASATELL